MRRRKRWAVATLVEREEAGEGACETWPLRRWWAIASQPRWGLSFWGRVYWTARWWGGI